MLRNASAPHPEHEMWGEHAAALRLESWLFLWENTGLWVGIATLVMTMLLELVSLPSVRAITKSAGGTALYAQAWAYTISNAVLLGPPIYGLVSHLLVVDRPCSGALACGVRTAVLTGGLLMVHSLGYWYAHMTMHTSWLYWAHRFHHRFATTVTPCVAMAVTPVEYCLAYMLPFIVGGLVLQPDRLSLLLAVSCVSLCNLLVHTERCAEWSLPWFLVSAEKHLHHHRRPNKHYSAPTFDVDAIMHWIGTCWQEHSMGDKRASSKIRDD
eukprot:Tamp_27950.p1 GENE.Tamp_27950~~Tamp_27950.p1  ORF type:complete len:269 (+),score=24.74 Tamp_27950:1-807(+)